MEPNGGDGSVPDVGSSFDGFWEAERDGIVRALALTIGDLDLAGEAVDEAMARAYQRWTRVGALDHPGGWVYRVALNWTRSWHRRRRRVPPVWLATPTDHVDPTGLDRLAGEHLHRRASGLTTPSGTLQSVRRRARQRTQHRIAGAGTVGIAAIALGGVAATRHDSRPGSIAPATTTSTQPTTTLVQVDLRRGDTGEAVRALQQALADRGYDPGDVDGVFGEQTEQAVWAYEGMEMGRLWQDQTGVVDATFRLQLVDSVATVAPRRPQVGDHTEIFLDTQVLVVFRGKEAVLITHISSGDGQRWCERVTTDIDDDGAPLPDPLTKDLCGVSVTPPGVFRVYRRSDRLSRSTFGATNKPVFFNYGIAVGGALNVPRQPASHGTVRIPMTISEYFPSLVENGDSVYVFDGTTEPEDVARPQTLPVFPYPDPTATTAP